MGSPIIIINKLYFPRTGQETGSSLIFMLVLPSLAPSLSSTSSSLDLSVPTVQTTPSFLMESAANTVQKDIIQQEKKCVSIVGKDIAGKEQPA